MDHVTLGTRVYYKDTGPEDMGTIIDIILDDYPFVIKWDEQKESRFVENHVKIPQLGVDYIHISNPADENIDRFQGSQLVFVE